MKVILDDFVNKELIKYLKTQEGILDVKLNEIDTYIEVNVNHNEKITPYIIMKHIDLFLESTYPSIIQFNKELNVKTKHMHYEAGDMCCEYCYKGFIKEMFDNNKIISIKSNYDIYNPAIDIKFEIEYDEKYSEEEVINFIKENI